MVLDKKRTTDRGECTVTQIFIHVRYDILDILRNKEQLNIKKHKIRYFLLF